MSTACMDTLSSAMQLLMATDASSGKTYFIHVESKRTFWETPAGAVVVGRATAGGASSAATASRDHAKPSSTSAHGPVEGFAYKSDPKAKNWKQRWFIIDAGKHTATYFSNNPKVTLMRYKVTERPKGEILLAGAQIQEPGPMPRGAPVEHGFRVQLHSGKMLWVGMATREAAEAWHSALTSAAKGEAVSRRASVIMAGAAGAGGAWAHITTVPSRPHAMSGWLMKSAPDNRTWTKRWAVLDPGSAQLAYSEQAGSPVLGTLQLEDGTTVVPGVGPAVLAAVGSSAAAHMPGFHVIGAPAWKGTEQPKLRAMGRALRVAAGDELPPSAAVGMPASAAGADDEALDGSRVYTFLAQDESTLQRWVTALVSAKVGASYGASGVIAPIGSAGTAGAGLARLQAAARKVMHVSVATRPAAPRNLSGWLYKSNSAGKYWKRRWMKVWVSPPHEEHGVCAMYYTSLDEKCLKGIVVLNSGKIEVGKREHLPALKNAPTAQGVVLATPSRVWRFSLDNMRECDKWVVALSQGVFLADRMPG